MKAIDVVQQLAIKLPQVSDKFTTNSVITSLTRVGSVVTADTATDHGLSVGSQTNIVGAESPIGITSITRVGAAGALVTGADHDLTKFSVGAQTVKLSGSIEAEFNGSFVLLSVPNRRTITFTMVDAGPTTATGTPLLLNGSSIKQGYNGLFSVVSVPTTTQFTYNITTSPPLTTATGTINARSLPRISAGVSIERLIDSYTKQSLDEVWAFVILGDVVASKNRDIDSDAVENLQRGNHYRQQLIQPFMVLTMVPASNEIAARKARDLAEDLLKPICQSLLFSKLDSGLSEGAQNPVAFSDHGFGFYDSAVYGHTYAFQSVADITFDDTIGFDDDVAFRDICTSMGFKDIGNQILLADIDLDATPIADGYNIKNAVYDSVSFLVSGQDATPEGLFFRADGKKMYIPGSTGDKIYQYSLSSAWDLLTMSYDSKFFSVAGQDAVARGVHFKPDGTRMYIVGDSNARIFQYDLGTPWDVPTAVYNSVSFPHPTGSPMDIFFKTDGSRMFTVDGFANIFQFDLSTAWDLSTAVNNTEFTNVNLQGTSPTAIFIRDNGLDMYMVGSSSDKIHQYLLSTAWDVRTAAYTNNFISVSSEDTLPSGLYLGSEGHKMFMVGTQNGTVYQYSL